MSFLFKMLALRHPFTATVAGPTGCGKTQFTFRLIENASQMISPAPRKIYYCYGEYQTIFAKYPQVIFNEGLPDVSNFDGKDPVLLVIDDLMQETNHTVANIFTSFTSPKRLSTLFHTESVSKE